MTQVFDYSQDKSRQLIADSVAREPWTLHLLESLGRCREDGYEQWGMLQGEINVDDENAMNLTVRGPRVHSWEQTNVDLGFHRSVAVTVFMEDGTMMKLNGSSTVNGLTE